MRALSIAATGMAAQEMQLEVVANNIANTNTKQPVVGNESRCILPVI